MSPRILIVDDDPDLRILLREFFEKKEFRVALAPDGPSALAAARREKPDVILLDLRLPLLDGLEVLKSLREADRQVPILVITATEDLALAKRVLASGANDYITKPLDMRYLQYAACLFAQEPPAQAFFPLKGIW